MKYKLIDDRYKIISLASQNIEEYEQDNNNIMKISTGDREIDPIVRKVVISLSKEAMIGLGHWALRLSNGFPEGCELRTEPLGAHCANQQTGFYLTPNSAELFFYHKEFGDLDSNGIKKSEKKHHHIENWKKNKGKLLVDMYFDDEFYEGYNIGSKNVGEIMVYEKGKELPQNGCLILYLSHSAFLGLGTTMLRIANNYKEGDSYTINPEGVDTQNSGLGFYLTNDSPELEVRCKTFEDALFYDPNIYI